MEEGQNSTANVANPTRTGNEAVPVEDEMKVSSHEKRETATYGYYESSGSQFETVYDGILDPSSNYTGFVEVVGKFTQIQNTCRVATSWELSGKF